MQIPTSAELLSAIEVLKKLGERINTNATHSVLQMPSSHLDGRYAGRIEVNAIEQTSRIEGVAEQLKNWRDELIQQRRQHVSQSV